MTRLEVGKTYPTRDGRVAKVKAIRGDFADIEITTTSVEKDIVDTKTGLGNPISRRPYHNDLILPYRVRRVLVYEGPKEKVKYHISRCDANRSYWENERGISIIEESTTEF